MVVPVGAGFKPTATGTTVVLGRAADVVTVPQGTKAIVLYFGNMRRLWRALDARVRQYYSVLLNDVPPELIQVLRRRLSDRRAAREEPKIDRVRPGGTRHVRMPGPR
jgi:hypothetical protein